MDKLENSMLREKSKSQKHIENDSRTGKTTFYCLEVCACVSAVGEAKP